MHFDPCPQCDKVHVCVQCKEAFSAWAHYQVRCLTCYRIYKGGKEQLAQQPPAPTKEQISTWYKKGYDKGFHDCFAQLEQDLRKQPFADLLTEAEIGGSAKLFRDLLFLIHPDRNPHDQARATRVMQWLTG